MSSQHSTVNSLTASKREALWNSYFINNITLALKIVKLVNPDYNIIRQKIFPHSHDAMGS